MIFSPNRSHFGASCARTTRGCGYKKSSRGCMLLATRFLRQAAIVLVLAAATFQPIPARADDEFPFGLEMTLDAARQPGSKAAPDAGHWRQRRGHARTVVQGRQGPVFNCRQHRDLCRRSVGGSRLPTGAGAGRRRTGRSIERGRDLEAAGRFRFIHRNETAALPSQH
jgi:hypothetical protein